MVLRPLRPGLPDDHHTHHLRLPGGLYGLGERLVRGEERVVLLAVPAWVPHRAHNSATSDATAATFATAATVADEPTEA